MKRYYEAYDERYKAAHAQGVSWENDIPTPIVREIMTRYPIGTETPILEIGCGEGRDAGRVLSAGYRLTAVDISPEAIRWCREKYPAYADSFSVLDCINGSHAGRYGFIYAVAVLHMLVKDEDRRGLYRFIREHLAPGGIALLCTMGDGEHEQQSDPAEAFSLRKREHRSGTLLVPATSCRMVSFESFRKELAEAGLTICELGLSSAMPSFNSLMYAVVK